METGRFQHETYNIEQPSRCSIVLNHVYKTRGKKVILNDINLVAHSGQICAVHGEINSGKSMLLSCLVGGTKIDKGHIWVLGGKPGTNSSKTFTKRIGYMPQKFCLYQTMTFLEVLTYFGQLYRINNQFILWRINYYNEWFTLPPANVTIKNLSFSEKRIVSFLIAVFHRPRLVVLDEPTVGLDIFKRKQIWKYLHHVIITWKPTVVITTNTIEEAFLATKIAYLKHGQIIFKKEVEELQHMNPNKSINIIVDDLYSSIMSNIDYDEWNDSNQTEIPHDKELNFYKRIKPRSNIWKFKTIAIENIHFVTRNIWIFIMICLIPTLQVLLHCNNYKEYPDISFTMAVYNQETTNCVYNPCKRIENCTYFSCNYFNFFSMNNIQMNYYDSEPSARDSLTTGSTLGFINVSKNYTTSIIKSMTESTFDNTALDALDKSIIFIELDMLNFEVGKYLKRKLLNVQRLHLTSIYRHYNLSEIYAEIPIKINNEHSHLDFTEITACGIISCAIFSSAMLYSALLLQSEIHNGYLKRNIIAGVTIFEILLSIISIQTIFSIIQTFCLILLVEYLLYINWKTSLLLIILLDIGIGVCGTSIGLLIGSFANNTNKVFHITLIVYFINVTMSGVFWPFDYITISLQPFAIVMPLSMPIRAVNGVWIQGMRQLKSLDILYACVSITFWTAFSFTILIYRLRKKMNFIIY